MALVTPPVDAIATPMWQRPAGPPRVALQAGQVSDIVETPFGLHIIKVEEKRQKPIPPFEEVREKGERLRSRLEQFIGNYPELFEGIRGKGLMLGLRMKVEPRPFMAHLRDNHRLLTVAAGDKTLRILPPLVIGDAEIDEFFDKLSAGAADYQPPAEE